MRPANLQAARLNHEYIGTEHILPRLLADASGDLACETNSTNGSFVIGVLRRLGVVVARSSPAFPPPPIQHPNRGRKPSRRAHRRPLLHLEGRTGLGVGSCPVRPLPIWSVFHPAQIPDVLASSSRTCRRERGRVVTSPKTTCHWFSTRHSPRATRYCFSPLIMQCRIHSFSISKFRLNYKTSFAVPPARAANGALCVLPPLKADQVRPSVPSSELRESAVPSRAWDRD